MVFGDRLGERRITIREGEIIVKDSSDSRHYRDGKEYKTRGENRESDSDRHANWDFHDL